jgi:hypothetical protein
MSEYICHSGGCDGSDITWEMCGEEYGVKTISYSFYNHKQKGKNPKILTVNELEEGYKVARVVSKVIGRDFDRIQYNYVKNLIARNWYQVKNCENVYAIIKSFIRENIVEGGTGWAVQMGIENGRGIYVFNQVDKKWYVYDYVNKRFTIIEYTPKLTKNFAGIGTRELTDDGIESIMMVYKETFGK